MTCPGFRKRICRALLQLESVDASRGDECNDDCTDSDASEAAAADTVTVSEPHKYSVLRAGSFKCSSAVHAITARIRSAKLRPNVRTHVLLSDKQFEVLVTA